LIHLSTWKKNRLHPSKTHATQQYTKHTRKTKPRRNYTPDKNQQNIGLLWEKHKQIQDTNRGGVAAIKTGAFNYINIFCL
jgi:hypothetical protein